jgi:hypothetical protein
MAEKFSFKEDWKYINWKSTLLTNLYRSIGAGVVLFLLTLIFRTSDAPLWQRLMWPLIVPLGYFILFLPLGLLTSSLNRVGIPFIGLISVVCSFFIVPGDPIVWIFDQLTGHKYIPVKDFQFLNFALILFVINEEKKLSDLHGFQAA